MCVASDFRWATCGRRLLSSTRQIQWSGGANPPVLYIRSRPTPEHRHGRFATYFRNTNGAGCTSWYSDDGHGAPTSRNRRDAGVPSQLARRSRRPGLPRSRVPGRMLLCRPSAGKPADPALSAHRLWVVSLPRSYLTIACASVGNLTRASAGGGASRSPPRPGASVARPCGSRHETLVLALLAAQWRSSSRSGPARRSEDLIATPRRPVIFTDWRALGVTAGLAIAVGLRLGLSRCCSRRVWRGRFAAVRAEGCRRVRVCAPAPGAQATLSSSSLSAPRCSRGSGSDQAMRMGPRRGSRPPRESSGAWRVPNSGRASYAVRDALVRRRSRCPASTPRRG